MAQSDVVDAYVRLYSTAALEDALRKALAQHATGVTITSITFDGGGHSGQINGKVDEIIATLNAALEAKELLAAGKSPAREWAHGDFSQQILGT